MKVRCLMKSVPTSESIFTSIPDRLWESKTLDLLKSKSMKSQNGRMPVPPQTNTTDPDEEMVSNFNPAPIGSDKIIYPLNFELKSFGVSSPFSYFLIIKGTFSVSWIASDDWCMTSSNWNYEAVYFIFENLTNGKCFSTNLRFYLRIHQIVV